MSPDARGSLLFVFALAAASFGALALIEGGGCEPTWPLWLGAVISLTAGGSCLDGPHTRFTNRLLAGGVLLVPVALILVVDRNVDSLAGPIMLLLFTGPPAARVLWRGSLSARRGQSHVRWRAAAMTADHSRSD